MAFDPLAPLKLGVRIGIGVVRFELRVLEHLLGLDREQPAEAAPEPFSFEPEPAAPRAAEAQPEPPVPLSVAPEPQPALEPEPPAHIDTEPELVAEFSEPGAEEGAGAELHVAEPWAGYRRMRVSDIRDRIVAAGPEELAVTQLYEATHRKRRSVLDAVEKRTKQLSNAPARG